MKNLVNKDSLSKKFHEDLIENSKSDHANMWAIFNPESIRIKVETNCFK